MTATDVLRAERAALCDTLEEHGPDAPTLCEGWTTADLAAHMVARERRPDTGPGILLGGAFARHTDRVMNDLKSKGFDHLVARLRSGPPFPMRVGPGALVNVNENWIHHEDVRRANGTGPRPLDPEVDAIFWRLLRIAGFGLRKVPVGVEAVTPDGRRRVLHKGEPSVTITGDAPEIAFFCSGRRDAAVVELAGPDDAIAALRCAQLGI